METDYQNQRAGADSREWCFRVTPVMLLNLLCQNIVDIHASEPPKFSTRHICLYHIEKESGTMNTSNCHLVTNGHLGEKVVWKDACQLSYFSWERPRGSCCFASSKLSALQFASAHQEGYVWYSLSKGHAWTDLPRASLMKTQCHKKSINGLLVLLEWNSCF